MMTQIWRGRFQKFLYPKWQNGYICNRKPISIYSQYIRTVVPKLLHRTLENNIENSLSIHRSHISPCWLSLRPWRARGQSSVTAPQLPSPCCSLRNPSCSCFWSICSFILKLCTALLNHYYNCCFNFGSLSIVISLSSLHRTYPSLDAPEYRTPDPWTTTREISEKVFRFF